MGVCNLNSKVSIITIKYFRFRQLFILLFFSIYDLCTSSIYIYNNQDLNISYERTYADEDQQIQHKGLEMIKGLYC
ncbi:hypothetical protein CFP56_029114 [Quercus suber]|uniref:Uncharacterized protein n=1 Tax=Quercus suber TaxID=58331 RepID=A0AAW0MB94_QUESU